jgi:hypothetical protein
VKPSGKGRRCLVVKEIAEVDIFQRFQYEAHTNAFLGSEIFCRVELKYSWIQPNLRIGENGQPGASGISVPLRKRINAVRWLVKSAWLAAERGDG